MQSSTLPGHSYFHACFSRLGLSRDWCHCQSSFENVAVHDLRSRLVLSDAFELLEGDVRVAVCMLKPFSIQHVLHLIFWVWAQAKLGASDSGDIQRVAKLPRLVVTDEAPVGPQRLARRCIVVCWWSLGVGFCWRPVGLFVLRAAPRAEFGRCGVGVCLLFSW